jgi:AcrR family transcriptional regulator
MDKISFAGEGLDKTNSIVNAAQVCFGKYGFDKTSMKEIAEMIGMSKASLYYYFQDKESLFKAVLEKEKSEYFQIVGNLLSGFTNPVEKLHEYVKLRFRYFRIFLNLSKISLDEFPRIKPLFSGIFEEFKKKDIETTETILKTGIEQGIFLIEDVKETSLLFADLIKGMKLTALNHIDFRNVSLEESEAFERKMTLFTNIFIKGISK